MATKTDGTKIAEAIENALQADYNLYTGNIAEVLHSGCRDIAKAIYALGNAGASTPMGAIEAHGIQVGRVADGLLAVASAIGDVAVAISEKE